MSDNGAIDRIVSRITVSNVHVYDDGHAEADVDVPLDVRDALKTMMGVGTTDASIDSVIQRCVQRALVATASTLRNKRLNVNQ